ncbi:proline-, glutamic acid- and leucine-rich protein 1-like [Esox lucius]|uniref:proline-, glutamic acid- and leucine-rich protein 1-like n=1 Tax=Esox lucius TaxID=8010 RepID=UPI0014776A67|nr:proline-, glutamic acid- and leucine-rich protein 1-like [Esox lucius]
MIERAALRIQLPLPPLPTPKQPSDMSFGSWAERVKPVDSPAPEVRGFKGFAEDYLLHQTGQPLQSVDPDTEETDQLLEDLAVDGEEEEEEDEGFEEFTLDFTVCSLLDDVSTTSCPAPSASSPAPSASSPAPSASSPAPSGPQPATSTTPQPASSPPAVTPQVPEEQWAMDEHNRPGMDRVDSLAECLVELRNQTRLTLNNQQESQEEGEGDANKMDSHFAGLPQNRVAGSGQWGHNAGDNPAAGGGEPDNPHPVAQRQGEEAGSCIATAGD